MALQHLTLQEATGPARPDGALVAAHGLGVVRAGRWLIRDVSLAVRPGEIVTIVGPNGAGKTTLLRAMLGLERSDAGRVERASGLTTGYVPQRLAIDPAMPLTVRRLMTLIGRSSRAAVDRALYQVGIGHLAEAAPQTLSGGEFQRLLLARAISRRPGLLVLDEPVQGVDVQGEVALYDLIARLRDDLGCGVLLVSHDLHVVMARTDTVVCLNGHVCCHGPPETVAESPEYRRLFGPRAAETLAVYRHRHDHGHAADGSVVPLAQRQEPARKATTGGNRDDAR